MYKNLKSTYDYFDYDKLLDRDILPSTIQKSSNKVLTIDRHYKNFNSGIITRYCEHREDEQNIFCILMLIGMILYT